MKVFCPNFSLKEVKEQFDTLVDKVGENVAYYLWNKHEGNYELASQDASSFTQQQEVFYQKTSSEDKLGFYRDQESLKADGFQATAEAREAWLQNRVVELQDELYYKLKELYPEISINIKAESKPLEGEFKGRFMKAQKQIDIIAMLASEDTIPHEYAHYYIDTFRDTEIVQEAINKWGSEEALVQAIGEQAVKQKGEAWSWWDKFVNWLRNKYNSWKQYDKEQLKNILTNAYLARQDLREISAIKQAPVLQHLQNNFYSRNAESIDKLYEEITKGVKSRLNTLKRYGKRNLEVEQQISRLIDDLNKADSKSAVMQFVDHVEDTLATTIQFLNGDISNINSKQLVQLKHDYLDFYYPMMKDVSYLINNTDILNDLPDYEQFVSNVSADLGSLQQIQDKFDYILKHNTREFLVDYATRSGSPFVGDMIQWLEDPKNDISWLGYYIGMSSNSSNEVIRIMENILRNTQNKTNRNTYDAGMSLVNILKKAKEEFGQDVATMFQEKDKNGLPTGYITRSLNYGLMYQDEKAYQDKVIKDMVLEIDTDGSIVFPDYSTKQEYNKRMNRWYAKYTHRRYTPEYYELKNKLSEVTVNALDEVQKEINYILDRYSRGDIFLSVLMTDKDRNNLDALLKEKENLSSEYYYDGTKKDGTDLQIAQELREFYKKTGEGLSYKANMAKFNKAASMVSAKYGAQSKEFQNWVKYNTQVEFTDEFYERLAQLERAEQSEEYNKLVDKRKQLLKMYRLPNTTNEYMDLSEKQQKELRDLEQEIANLRVKGPKTEFNEFAEIAKTDQYYEDYNRYKNLGPTDFDNWFQRNHYENQSGYMVPVSRYTYLKPKDEYMSKYSRLVPGRFFRELDGASTFADNEFNTNEDEYIQPKKEFYDNSKEFNKIKGSAKELYDAIIKDMEQSNEKISFLSNSNKYKLPQMSARDMTLLSRGGLTVDNIKYILKDNLTIKDDDSQYNVSNSTRPDGSPIKNIPTRYMRMLDDPTKITSDVVGSVIMYHHMAENFRNMSEVQYDLEMILERLSQLEMRDGKKQKAAGTLRAFQKAQDLLNMNLYGQKKNVTTIGGRDISKPLGSLYQFVTKVNLAFNPWAIMTNFVTGQGYTDIEGILGRYYDKSDIAFAKEELMSNYADVVTNIGNVNHKNKIMMLLQLNQVSRSNEETFDRLDQSATMRAINQHFWFNGYSAGDFTVKSQVLLAVYHNYKLHDGKFMSKNQFLSQYYADNKEAGESAWKELKTTLYDAYDIKDDKLVVLDEYKDLVTEQLKNAVTNKAQTLAGKIDGMLTDTDRAQIHANAYAQFVVMHRNFMIVGLEDRFKGTQFNYNTGEVERGLYQSAADVIKSGFGKKKFLAIKQMIATYDSMSDYEKYNVRKVILELGNIVALSLLVSLILVPAADDDKDNLALQAASYVAMRTAFEFRTMYNPFELTSLLNSPSAAVNVIETGSDMLKVLWIPNYFGDGNPFATVKSGAYKGFPKVLRNIIKASPGHGLIEMWDPQTVRAKRNYLEHQLMF